MSLLEKSATSESEDMKRSIGVCTNGPRWRFATIAFCCLVAIGALPNATKAGETGVTSNVIRIGGVMDLEGRSRGLGRGMRVGIEAAFAGQLVQSRRLEFVALNDSYTPAKTIDATQRLLDQGVFVVLGNVGTPTAKVSLPILAEHKVPAVGFFTGAGILRPGVGDIINYRASYVQETAAVIDAALKAGMTPKNVCAYVQNDAYGMAGVVGIKRALAASPGSAQIIKAIDQILALEGEDPPRNNIGPVGVYTRNTFTSRAGYQSLKSWEARSGAPCRLVVSVGTYNAIARFAGYARYKREDWIISAVSFTGADDFRATLNEFGVTDRVVMTQVVPSLDSNLPIVVAARRALGDDFGYVSLEGFIVGKMLLAAMLNTKGELTRANLLRTIRGNTFELGGLKLDFVDNNQGSDLVVTTYLDGNQYRVMGPAVWERMLRL